MSGRYLYCLSCADYLGSLGGDSCNCCGWEAEQEAGGESAAPDIEAAAKELAKGLDYPWDGMTTHGRDGMRRVARSVVDAALKST